MAHELDSINCIQMYIEFCLLFRSVFVFQFFSLVFAFFKNQNVSQQLEAKNVLNQIRWEWRGKNGAINNTNKKTGYRRRTTSSCAMEKNFFFHGGVKRKLCEKINDNKTTYTRRFESRECGREREKKVVGFGLRCIKCKPTSETQHICCVMALLSWCDKYKLESHRNGISAVVLDEWKKKTGLPSPFKLQYAYACLSSPIRIWRSAEKFKIQHLIEDERTKTKNYIETNTHSQKLNQIFYSLYVCLSLSLSLLFSSASKNKNSNPIIHEDANKEAQTSGPITIYFVFDK